MRRTRWNWLASLREFLVGLSERLDVFVARESEEEEKLTGVKKTKKRQRKNLETKMPMSERESRRHRENDSLLYAKADKT